MNWLNKNSFEFPDYDLVDESGIIAVGGDLNPKRLITAYNKGIFPWYSEEETPILWWFPHKRFVLFPNELRVSKSMRQILRKNTFTITENKEFEAVITACQQVKRKEQNGTWINNNMLKSYLQLHKLGIAKSIEVWQNNNLVGGLYGIDVNNIFCGESMFSLVSNASKAGFIYFVNKYKNKYKLIDCQVYTNHLASLGAKEISAEVFLSYLSN